MGQARRRQQEIETLKVEELNWKKSFTPDEQVVFDVAMALYDKFVRPAKFYEGCYHLTFVMAKYLESRGIIVTPVVGWINDGTWDGAASHAWIELNGKKTDISLTQTEFPEHQPSGALIIHDRVIHKGSADYRYFVNGSAEALEGLENLKQEKFLHLRDILQMKAVEHIRMNDIAESRSFDAYLSQAPLGLGYEDICRAAGLS